MTRKFTSYSKHTMNDKLLRRHVSRTFKFENWWNIKWNWVDRHTARQKKKKNLNKFEPRIREETNWKITTSSRKTDETENPISTNTWVSNPKVDKAIKPNPNPWKGRWNFGVGVKALTDSFKTWYWERKILIFKKNVTKCLHPFWQLLKRAYICSDLTYLNVKIS